MNGLPPEEAEETVIVALALEPFLYTVTVPEPGSLVSLPMLPQ